jgi:hypothetical protein
MAINKKTNEVGCGSSHLKSQLLRRKSSSRSRFKTRKGKKFSRSPSQPRKLGVVVPPVIPARQEVVNRRITVQASPGKNLKPYSKNN